ncbi:hypothetical protein ACFE04_010441 [Oxalis oulophora]
MSPITNLRLPSLVDHFLNSQDRVEALIAWEMMYATPGLLVNPFSTEPLNFLGLLGVSLQMIGLATKASEKGVIPSWLACLIVDFGGKCTSRPRCHRWTEVKW